MSFLLGDNYDMDGLVCLYRENRYENTSVDKHSAMTKRRTTTMKRGLGLLDRPNLDTKS